MSDRLLRETIEAVRAGTLDVDEACRRLGGWQRERLEFATIDHERTFRNGFPEVIFCAGKTPAQAAAIAERIHDRSGRLLATRAGPAQAEAIAGAVPGARYNEIARTVTAGDAVPIDVPPIAVVAAGTSDLPVAEEAVETIRLFGQPVDRLVDVGVAGLHRLLARADALDRAGVVVVVAGMEGALPSVVGGLVDVPVIAVPTSVGYGAAFGGIAALLGMLTSCAPGVVVVNIDNGFGAGFAAARMNAMRVAESAEASGRRTEEVNDDATR